MATDGTTSTHASDVISAALDYAGRGWRVVPLYGLRDGKCECGKERCKGSAGKHPRINGWDKEGTADEATILAWLEKWPHSNLGVQLGEKSGIIDIEFDDDIGKATAEKYLAECFTPTFVSGRSTHRLFKWDSELPAVAMTKWNGLEIRIGGGNMGSQTVFPPSKHHSGVEYRWHRGLGPDDVEVLPIPEQLMIELHNDPEGPGKSQDNHAKKDRSYWEKIASGAAEGSRNVSLASWYGGSLRGLASLEDNMAVARVFLGGEAVNRLSTPPLDDEEVLQIWKSIFSKEHDRRLNIATAPLLPMKPDQVAKDAAGNKPSPFGFKLTIVRSDPPRYELWSPVFELAKNSTVHLTVAEFNDFRLLRNQVQMQAEYPLGKSVRKAWDDTAEMLVRTAEKRESDPEGKRSVAIAEVILSRILRARQQEILTTSGGSTELPPTKLPTGETYVSLSWLATECSRIPGDKITRADVVDIMGIANAKAVRLRTTAGQGRYYCFTEANINILKTHVGC